MQRVWALVDRLSRAQRQERIGKLKLQPAATVSIEALESAGRQPKRHPRCAGRQIVPNGSADGLQRRTCRNCRKRFNVLTGTLLAKLRHKERWREQVRALADGLTG